MPKKILYNEITHKNQVEFLMNSFIMNNRNFFFYCSSGYVNKNSYLYKL